MGRQFCGQFRTFPACSVLTGPLTYLLLPHFIHCYGILSTDRRPSLALLLQLPILFTILFHHLLVRDPSVPAHQSGELLPLLHEPLPPGSRLWITTPTLPSGVLHSLGKLLALGELQLLGKSPATPPSGPITSAPLLPSHHSSCCVSSLPVVFLGL